MDTKNIIKNAACFFIGGLSAYGSMFIAYKAASKILKDQKSETDTAFITKVKTFLEENKDQMNNYEPEYITEIEERLNKASEMLPHDYELIQMRINDIIDNNEPRTAMNTFRSYMATIKIFIETNTIIDNTTEPKESSL